MNHIFEKSLEIKNRNVKDTDLCISIGPVAGWRMCAYISDMANEDIGWSHEEAEAYAKLFCAAPDLVRACAEYCMKVNQGFLLAGDSYRKIKSALEKSGVNVSKYI